MRKVYEEAIKQANSEEEVRARHILVETEDEAKAIVEQLKGGADFAALAKEKSKDPGSAQNGGDLDFMASPSWCRSLRKSPSRCFRARPPIR